MEWDWQVFCTDTITMEPVQGCFGPNGDITYLDWLMSAWGWTAAVSGASLILAIIVGALIGTLRTLPNGRFLPTFGTVWVELFRNIPLLVQIFLWYYVIPGIFPVMKEFPGFVLVVFALGFFTSARIAEQVRAGIQSLPRGQLQAAMAMGMTVPQAYRYVVLPMAFRIIVPPLTSEAMGIVKNSSVAFAVSISELTMYAMQVQEETSRGIEVYLAVTTLYIITALIIYGVMVVVEKQIRIPGLSAAGGGR